MANEPREGRSRHGGAPYWPHLRRTPATTHPQAGRRISPLDSRWQRGRFSTERVPLKESPPLRPNASVALKLLKKVETVKGLLREPGGFEGLVEREVGVPTNDLAVLERVDEGDVLLNLHVPSPHVLTSQLNDNLAAVDDLQDLSAEFIPLTGPVSECLDHPVVPPIRLGVRQFGWLTDQHLRVEVDEQRPKVAISDRGEIRGDGQGLLHDLDVLLRHRLPRQSNGFEGLTPATGLHEPFLSSDLAAIRDCDKRSNVVDGRPCTAAASVAEKVGTHRYVIREVDDLPDLIGPVAPGIVEVGVQLADAF